MPSTLTKIQQRPISVIRSVLAALSEAGLWTMVAPALIREVGSRSGVVVAVPPWLVGVACLAGGVLGGLWLPERESTKAAPSRAPLFVATGLAGLVAALVTLSEVAAITGLFAYWRGISSAGHAKDPYYLRGALTRVLVAFGLFGLVFAHLGLPLPPLLAGLFVAVASGLGALLFWTDSNIMVGVNTYSLPNASWQRQVALGAIALVVGLPAILVSLWALWAGPAASGLGAVGRALSLAAGGLVGLFTKVMVVVLIPAFWLIDLLIAWLRAHTHVFTPTQGILAGEEAVPDWMRQAANGPIKSWHIPAFISFGVLTVLAAALIYRFVRSAVAFGSQRLNTEFEDLPPIDSPHRANRARAGRGRAVLAELPPVRAAYRSFLLKLAALGRPRSASTTPVELSAALKLDAEASENLAVLTGAYIQARYGPPQRLNEPMERGALESWRALRARLSRLGGSAFPGAGVRPRRRG